MILPNRDHLRDLANAMRRDFSPGKSPGGIGRTVLLTGAGCSVSAKIPLAKDIAQELVCKLSAAYGLSEEGCDSPELSLKKLVEAGYFQLPEGNATNEGRAAASWSAVYDQIFSSHYNSPKEVHRIFSDIFDKNGRRINWTHICIGELVRVGYISTVLTTNFDQLALEGIARAGRLPIVADGLEYLGRITGDSPHPQLIQIHGSRHTYHLRNSIEDTEELSRDHSARHTIDELFRTARVFLAVGYGGREKGIMELLIEAGKRYPDTRIYWCTYSEQAEDLPPLVKEFLDTSKHAKVIFGYDSDQFFDELLGHLNIRAPKIIEDPLFILRELTESIEIGDDSAIAQKIGDLKLKTQSLRAAEAHVAALTSNQKLQFMGQLAGGIAHDFNNVLTAILLSLDHLMMMGDASDPVFLEHMEMKRNANRASVLVRQLLAFSRKQPLKMTVLDINTLIGDLRMLLDRMVNSKVKITVEYEKDLWRVKADLGQFEQVLINLAVNARDAMPDGGTITIRTRNLSLSDVQARDLGDVPPADYVEVVVEDDGVGIGAAMLEKIFDPFFSTKDGHTGLGLAMVYGIVRQSGGHISVTSNLGKGTTFRILVPRTLEEFAQPAARAEPASLTFSDEERGIGGSEVVLLAEDEEAVRKGIKRMLETRGYTVHEAESGTGAMELLEEVNRNGGSIDLIVSNVNMPSMDGPTLLQKVRAIHPKMKFMFISGFDEEALARNLPADAEYSFLPKPFSLKQLAVAVREMLRPSSATT